MYGQAALACDKIRPSLTNNLGVGSHPRIMHYALSDCKRLLRHDADYALWMDTANARLKNARENAGFSTAVEAADALGVPRSTYIGHENGHRGFPASRAPAYARRFKVSEEWLLYGKDGKPDPLSEDALIDMVALAVQELPVGATLADLPRIVGSNIHTQLEQLRAGSEVADLRRERHVRGKSSQSHVATKRGAAA